MALGSVHCYLNHRPDVDWNTCGQAAIATICDFWGKNPADYWPKGPSLPRDSNHNHDGRLYWDDGKAIDLIKAGGYGPDNAFGFGTSGGRIRDALLRYGFGVVTVGHSGFGTWGWRDQWDLLRHYLAHDHPVPVIVDLGRMGGPAWVYHWAIAYKVASGRVYLGACDDWNPSPTESDFLSAWSCSALPYGYNHCGVYS